MDLQRTAVNPADQSDLRDRLEIRELVDRYARAADRVDGDAAAALFTEDGALRIFERGNEVPVRERLGGEAIATAFSGLSRYDVTLHVVANHLVELEGDIATGETYCLAHHVRSIGEGADAHLSDYMMAIRYLDTFERTAMGWRIAQRHLQLEFTEERPVSGP
jgi:ketosteroid isomerase-like protein